MGIERCRTFCTVGFDLLTCFAPCSISFNVFLHVGPPVRSEECTFHLPHTGVSSSRDVVFMVENTFPYTCWHPDGVAISPNFCAVPSPCIVKFSWFHNVYCAVFLE